MWKRNCTARLFAIAAVLGLGACNTDSSEVPAVSERQAKIEEMIFEYRQLFTEVEGVSAAAVADALETGSAVVVDVRSPSERAISRIPGAISRDDFERRSAELAGSRVITYCTIGYRSSEYARELLADGWAVLNFDGSLLAWTHAGGELVDEAGRPTQRLHVYGSRWDLAAEGYETVW